MKAVVQEKRIIGLKVDVSAVFFFARSLLVAHKHTLFKDGLAHLSVAHTACYETARQGIHGLQTHTIHTHRCGKYGCIILTTRVEFRHSIHQRTKRNATAVVAYFGCQVVVNVHFYAFAKALIKLVDAIVYTLF